jgi:hypothetical protein
MVTREINENAELWFDDVRIRAKKVNGMPTGLVLANGGFLLPSTGAKIQDVSMSMDVVGFIGVVATKLGLDPAVVYQAICDSLEDSYNTSASTVTADVITI